MFMQILPMEDSFTWKCCKNVRITAALKKNLASLTFTNFYAELEIRW